MFDIDIIIPCYGPSDLIDRGVASIATQWKREFVHVTLVDDCSPNTNCHYQDLVDRYKDRIDIRCIVMPENSGQGLTRQFGIDSTSHQHFMFMDEDDQLAPFAISQFCDAYTFHGVTINPDGTYKTGKDGKPIKDQDVKNIAVISGPLFEFDDQHTHVIPAANEIWLNSKLYNRKFIEKHNIRFNKPQSRHAEDYYFMSCFFYALRNDDEYIPGYLSDDGLFYLWYPNEQSQSRVDPHYGFMLSGYTMDGSVNILKFIRENKTIPFDEKAKEQYYPKLLNMTVYSYYTFLAFLERIKITDYVPKLELDWTLLRDACNTMRLMVKENFDKYSYIQKIEELFAVKNMSDVQFPHDTGIPIEFDDYIQNGMDALEWSFEQLMETKEVK